MQCKKCDREMADTAKFCGTCGTPVSNAADTPSTTHEQGNVCQACKTVNKPGAKFCKDCGSKVTSQAEQKAPSEYSPSYSPTAVSHKREISNAEGSGQSRTARIAAVCLIIGLLAGGMGYLAYSKLSGKLSNSLGVFKNPPPFQTAPQPQENTISAQQTPQAQGLQIPQPAPESKREGQDQKDGSMKNSAMNNAAVIERSEAEIFVTEFVSLETRNDPDSFSKLMSMFADNVNYFNAGRTDRAFIENDKRKYFKYWFSRNYVLRPPLEFTDSENKNELQVSYVVDYSLQSQRKHGRGESRFSVLLQKDNGVLKIVSIKENAQKT